MSQSPDSGKRRPRRDGSVAPTPSVMMMFNPVRQMKWAWGFVALWFSTRPTKHNLAASLPFAIVCAGLIALHFAPPAVTRAAYESAARFGATNADDPLSRLSIQRLVSDYPQELEYQRLLAEQSLRDGDLVVATRLLRQVSSPDSSATSKQRALANLSLAKLSADESNRFSLEPKDFEERLSQVIATLPNRLAAHELLSVHYLKRKQLAEAEPHVARIVGQDPGKLFDLSQLQIRLGKKAEAQNTASTAIRLVAATIRSGKASSDDYVLQASLMNSLGQTDEAEKILVAGFERDADSFRSPLANHYVAVARQKLRISPFYRRQATTLLANAFRIAPDSSAVAELLTMLAQDKQGLSTGLSRALNEHWERRTLQSGVTAKTLASAAGFSRLNGDLANVVRLMERAAQQDNAYQDSLVEAYYSVGQKEKAMGLFDEISQRYRARLSTSPDDSVTRIRLARLLTSVARAEAAEAVLREAPTETRKVRSELVTVLRIQLSDAVERSEAPDPEKLRDAFERAPFDGFLLSLMAEQSVSTDVDVATKSREFILQLVAQGGLSAGLAYGALGTAELDAKMYKQASVDLLRSAQLEPQNPLAWNNLAMTLVRQGTPDINRAMQAVDRALRLLPDHETLLATKGEVLLRAERWAEASRVLQRAVGRGKNTVEIHQQLALAYRELGNEELAAQHDKLAKDAAQ